MNKRRAYRISIISGLVALTVLLGVQIYWFARAYSLEERQFNQQVTLAIREVVNEMLFLGNDSVSAMAPVQAVASNSYAVYYNRFIPYEQLDSLLKVVFEKHDVLIPFEINVYDISSGYLAFGNLYANGIRSSSRAVCLERELPKESRMSFTITFPGKRIDVVKGMSIWVFSAITFVLILVLLAIMMVDLSRQKKLAELKSDFVNNMTHELQTPITNISLASQVLIRSKGRLTDEKALHYVGIISAENERLKNHVDQVLQTTMLENGKLQLNKKDVDVHSVIEEVLRSFSLRVNSRGGELRSDLRADKRLIHADPFHLKNIFFSILDNADKYSPERPEILVTTSNVDHGLCVAITDHGIGIHHDAQLLIFDKFFRVNHGNVHDVKGFGLGLTYVREVVNAHQGTVTVSSEVSRGSCFQLYFQSC